MNYQSILTLTLTLIFTGTLVVATGCDSGTVAPEAQKDTLAEGNVALLATGSSAMRRGLATLRRATARYQRVEVAVEDGFVQAMPCADPPGPGAIAIPYVKLDRFDTTIDLEKPEVLFYEPQRNGRLHLVGAEPVVLIEEWDQTHDDPPSLFGQEFHRNEESGTVRPPYVGLAAKSGGGLRIHASEGVLRVCRMSRLYNHTHPACATVQHLRTGRESEGKVQQHFEAARYSANVAIRGS